MLDSTVFDNTRVSNKLNINAVSGTLVKNHKKSRFVVCRSDSSVFNENKPTLNMRKYDEYLEESRWKDVEVVVLQSMIIGEKLFLCEVVEKEDFEEV